MSAATCPITQWAHVPHGDCQGSAPEFPSDVCLDRRQVANRLRDLGHEWLRARCWAPDCGGLDATVSGWQCIDCGHYFPRPRVSIDEETAEAACRGGMGCRSVAAKLARRMRGHNLDNAKACDHGTCAEAKDPWTGWDRHGRPVAHFDSKAMADRALRQRVVAATSPIYQRTASR